LRWPRQGAKGGDDLKKEQVKTLQTTGGAKRNQRFGKNGEGLNNEKHLL